jgi:AcrR family transcriptional regulator
MVKTQRDLHQESTRRSILRSARRLFAQKGYSATTLDAVVRTARVTTGAVYHHFGSKMNLFRAVAESIEIEMLERVGIATRDIQDPWSRLVAGISAMLEICCEPDIRRIVLLDAPNLIGGAEWREIEIKYGYGAMYEALTGLQAAGVIRPLPVSILAPMLLGALIEAANSIAGAQNRVAALAAAREVISVLLQSLRLR